VGVVGTRFPHMIRPALNCTGEPMAKPNYSFEKRQRELAKKKKKEEKRLRKQAAEDAPKPPAD
jgi:hypothetical protein